MTEAMRWWLIQTSLSYRHHDGPDKARLRLVQYMTTNQQVPVRASTAPSCGSSRHSRTDEEILLLPSAVLAGLFLHDGQNTVVFTCRRHNRQRTATEIPAIKNVLTRGVASRLRLR